MPSGKVHAVTTLLVASFSGPALVAVGQPVEHAISFVGGNLLGLLVNPDLDVDSGNRSHYYLRNTTGCLGAAAWYVFWYPYAQLVRHRSPLSHMPVVGTLLRVAYLSLALVLIWAVLRLVLPFPAIQYPNLGRDWAWALAGLMLVDTIHALQDYLSSLRL